MKSLVIGDIHNDVDPIEKFLKFNSDWDEVIFLGDYFDSFFDDLSITAKTALWLKSKLNDSKNIMLFGNHDLHYRFFLNPHLRGSGYSNDKCDVICNILNSSDWGKLKYYYQSQEFVFSHAGFNISMLHPIYGFRKEFIDDSIFNESESIRNNSPSVYFSAGRARGGYLKVGGITWMDWGQEFEPIEGVNQIVGHTHSSKVRSKIKYNERDISFSTNINIDCYPNKIISIIDNKVSEISL